MSARIDVQVTGDEALVTVRGVIDRAAPTVVDGLLASADGCAAVVVDLREAVLASRQGA